MDICISLRRKVPANRADAAGGTWENTHQPGCVRPWRRGALFLAFVKNTLFCGGHSFSYSLLGYVKLFVSSCTTFGNRAEIPPDYK
ncbi:hypothetical protein GN956_G21758 [Arapaima gigas]